MQNPLAPASWRQGLDVGLLALALSLAAWIALRLRSRNWMTALSVASLAYFGFYRSGCICPIGATQNVTLGIVDSSYYLPVTVVAFFVLPLAFGLVFGRVFCAGVCWLGAMQDLVLIKPVRLPTWLERALGTLPFVYLGAAVLFAATNATFIICRYDPFVPFFRRSGPFIMFVAGGVVLILSTFVGRPYCRFLCPYGAMLSVLSRVSWKGVTITPDECIVCGLCRDECPFGAIEPANTPKEAEE
jgi:polyferredoxin